MRRSKKKAQKKADENAEAERQKALRAQRELAAFGETHKPRKGKLSEPEIWWRDHYQWLENSGYLLRPRYAPDWTPSWEGTKKEWFACEDGRAAEFPTRILDGTRLSDGAYVAFKLVQNSGHPLERDIGQLFSSEPLAGESANHCIPIYDVLVPEEDSVILVMPLLGDYSEPPFDTIGEAVECFRQLFEGLQFMHKHRVAHRYVA
ncbi:hypothetical protein BDN67DRAFT_1013046 [Paxillus ammoniavirescens]|nr:hypothetical protein BDN67DRAFT_1016857 [Paxillus ammoniavirescens]KAF8838518.1 hypothetical protein BDN67DRAFT_1013046 [Paxillus ammoniavirescens]